ncbi:MAG: CPBP family intramembrane glutamic endopeptidase [Nitriliruptoraceae bacterium]
MQAAARMAILREAAAVAALAMALSWPPWLLLLATTADPGAHPGSMVLWALGGLGPAAAALLVLRKQHGRPGLAAFRRSLTRWRVGRLWLVLLAPLPIGLGTVLLLVGTGRVVWQPGGPETALLVPVWLLGGLVFGGLEEAGWRGRLQPLLQDALHPLTAAVLVGLTWSIWHLPLFWLTGTTQAATSIVTFAVGAIGLSVVLGWVWNTSGGSTLLAVLLHGAVNGWYTATVQGLAPGSLDAGFGTITALAAVLAALAVVMVVGPALSRDRAPHDVVPSA